MARARSVFSCQSCGARAPAWEGRCRACGEWGTLVEECAAREGDRGGKGTRSSSMSELTALRDVDIGATDRFSSGIGELDRVLGGGWIAGSTVLIGGDPGVGKSTLLLGVGARVASGGTSAVYVSGEESPAQVKIRAERLGVQDSSLLVLAETELESVLARLDEARPQLVIVDSIQMMQLAALASAPGSISQVRECGAALVRFAKRTGAAVFVIGHVTKEGAIAGPRVLEHMVDTVLYFEGDLEGEYRVLRATKNRFGPVREIGVFSMEGEGLREVSNPSERLWARNRDEVSGSIAFPALEGSRVLLVEIQAIAAPSGLASPTRRVAGVDPNRLSLLAAVLEKKLGMTLWKNDLFVNVVGGIQASEPASDLAVCLTIVSSLLDRPLPAGTAAAGEVGLSGEVRPIPRPDLRAAEAARLGLRRIVLPPESAGKADPGSGLEVVPSASLAEAVEATLGR